MLMIKTSSSRGADYRSLDVLLHEKLNISYNSLRYRNRHGSSVGGRTVHANIYQRVLKGRMLARLPQTHRLEIANINPLDITCSILCRDTNVTRP
jgi:hypothetical protein